MTTTRWWWVRHAPVREDEGCIYGQKDLGCDCSDRIVFEAVGKILPRNAVWYASNLKRTHQTAAAIVAAGLPGPAAFPGPDVIELPELAEQHLGDWQGLERAAFFQGRDLSPGNVWFAPAHERAPGGESFADVVDRVRRAVEQITASHPGRDIIAVAHGGTVRSALAVALDLDPATALAFAIENCSITRLDHISAPNGSGWRVAMVNHQPWRGAPV
jgi:broad specificity phosphatase PhoE